jgi:biofilm PGA synthesis N-glycosyltransferase PgaC
MTIVEIVWIVLFAVQVIPFGTYLLYMRHIALHKPWNVKIDQNYEPEVSILLPTYNEASVITRKLDNIIESRYPLDKIEIVIVDSGSNDGTVDEIRRWIARNPRVKVNLFVEHSRRGMVHAENIGLGLAKYDVIVKTDADCFWEECSMRNILKYLSDPKVGAVAGLHKIRSSRKGMTLEVEKNYRDFYAWLRVGESKVFGTVLYEGELMAFKKQVLLRLGGFDEDIGGDDVPLALKMAKANYRAISASDAFFLEFTPFSWTVRLSQKVRRGKHVLKALLKYKGVRMDGGISALFVPMEIYIYAVNPVVLFTLCAISIPLLYGNPTFFLGFIVLLDKRIRSLLATHMINCFTMVLAALSLAFGRKHGLTWEKIGEIREQKALMIKA